MPESPQEPAAKKLRRDAVKQSVTTIAHEELVAGIDLTEAVQRAFGEEGLGIITVSGVPGLADARQKLLPLAWKFAHFPDEVKEKYVLPETYWAFGWSHGKEKLQGNHDFSKGSYYNNPQYNEPVTDPEIVKKYPSYAHKNVWPTGDLPELEPAFMDLGSLIVEVGKLLAKQCDTFVRREAPGYDEGKLFKLIQDSKTCKARLLHYFPQDDSKGDCGNDFSSWCGWHNDHGSLTGLVAAEYRTESGDLVPCPDPDAGLYITSRIGDIIKASVDPSHLIFQIGETAQVHSGGLLQSTPHAVRGCSSRKASGISRQTFAVFMQPSWDELMSVPEGADPELTQSNTAAQSLPAGVPRLRARWGTEECAFTTCNFGAFTNETLSKIH